ncbi:MAG: phage terminase large subunit family protein [Peptostreptococcaceae bacterium]
MSHQKVKKSKAEKWPSWLSKSLKVLKPPENLKVSQFADRYRILDSKTSAAPGPWRTSTTPYLEEIMNAFNDNEVEEVVFAKPTQVGGTEAMNNMLAYVIAQDPAPALVVYPTLDLAEYASKNRIQTMVDLSQELKNKYQIRDSKDLELQFDGMYVVLSGANSPASLASRPIRYLFLDEVDKYPPNSGKESDPISLAKERTKTFAYNKKIFLTSTPTLRDGNVWKAFESADEQRYFYVPCPHCGKYQQLKFSQIKWPKDITPQDAQEMAYYECEKCKGKINDSHKMVMLRNGKWKATKKSSSRKKLGFHLNTLYSPWVRFGDVAYEFLKSKDFPDMLQNFINSWLAEPWEDTQLKLNSNVVKERETEYEELVVPNEAQIITAGVDVQKRKLFYTIRAWGTKYTSWNIAHGEVLDFEDIEEIMNKIYKKKNGEEFQVGLCCIDSGDRTEEVYDFCYENSEWAIPIKGASQQMYAKYNISKIDKINSKANGMKLVLVNTGQYKDIIANRLKRENGTGSFMVHKDCDLDYAQQITNEHKVKVKKGLREVEVWKTKTARAPNHYLDCEVYACLAGDLLNVRYLEEYDDTESIVEEIKPKEQPSGGWLNKKGWI